VKRLVQEREPSIELKLAVEKTKQAEAEVRKMELQLEMLRLQ